VRQRKRGRARMKHDNWDEMTCPICDKWFYPEKNTRRLCEECNDKEEASK
jgi:hypothetical protein